MTEDSRILRRPLDLREPCPHQPSILVCPMPADRAALQRLYSLPRLTLSAAPTPVEEMNRLSDALVGDLAGSAAPRLLVKRDDAIPLDRKSVV